MLLQYKLNDIFELKHSPQNFHVKKIEKEKKQKEINLLVFCFVHRRALGMK